MKAHYMTFKPSGKYYDQNTVEIPPEVEKKNFFEVIDWLRDWAQGHHPDMLVVFTKTSEPEHQHSYPFAKFPSAL